MFSNFIEVCHTCLNSKSLHKMAKPVLQLLISVRLKIEREKKKNSNRYSKNRGFYVLFDDDPLKYFAYGFSLT